jgi:hypothetical protein
MPHTQRIVEAEIAGLPKQQNAEPERRKIAISDQQALLTLDIREILTGRVEVVDNRKRPAR